MKRRGFTLVEYTAALTIMVVIAGLASARMSRSALGTRENALRAELATVRAALGNYVSDNQCWPASLSDLTVTRAPDNGFAADGTTTVTIDSRVWRGPYLRQLVNDPISGTSFTYLPGRSGYIRSSATGTDSNGVSYTAY